MLHPLRYLSWGQLVLVLVALGLLAFGQTVFFKLTAVLPLGILSTLLGLGVLWWLYANPDLPVSTARALLLGLITAAYLGGAYFTAFAMQVDGTTTMLFVLLGLVLFFTVHSPFHRAAGPETVLDSGPAGRQILHYVVLVVLVFASMALVIFLAKKYLGFYDLSVDRTDFFRLRAVVGGAYDIPSGPFKAWGKLWLAFFYLVGFLLLHAFMLLRLKDLRPSLLWLLLFGLGNLGALSIAYLSFQGLSILPVQVLSENYNFYKVAAGIGGFKELMHFVENIVDLEMKYMKLHTCTHPPGGIVLNWLLHHLTSGNASVVALILGALTWTGVIPVYLIGRELYNKEFGYYAAAFYAALPNMLIFSYVSMDAFSATAIAWALAGVVIASRRPKPAWMFIAGLLTFGTAMFSFTILQFIPGFFIIAVIGLRDQGLWEKGVGIWLKTALIQAAWFVLGAGAPFLLLQLVFHGHFEYLRMLQNALAQFASPIQTRPWFIWFWLSPLQYLIHVGAAITALLIWRWRSLLQGAGRNDFLPWAGLITWLIVVMSAMVHNEADRLYLVYNVWVVLIASLALWRQPIALRYLQPPGQEMAVPEVGGGARLLFLVVLAFCYIQAVVIQILVVDYW